MPIKLDCPRCKQSLSVPSKKAGAYVNCPRCNGRFWVPGTHEPSAAEGTSATAPGDGGTATGFSGSVPVATPPGTSTAPPAPAGGGSQSIQPPPPPPAAPANPPTATSSTGPTRPAPSGSPPMAVPPGIAPASQPPGAQPPGYPPPGTRAGGPPPAPYGGVPATPAQAPPPGGPRPGTAPTTPRPSAVHKKVARFITTEATQSTIHPSPDGKLPELRLHQSEESGSSKEKGGSFNPLLLLGALCLSVALSVVLVMVDVDSEDASTLQKKQAARAYVDANYFSSDAGPNMPLEPYQICLRQAQQAHSRGDRATERKLYRKVLEMLRAERGVRQKGLTGSHDRDNKLEQKISILLSGD